MTSETPPAIAPENYIVRIYYRAPIPALGVAGTVEVVATGVAHAFNTIGELHRILGVAARRGPMPRHGVER